MADLCERAATQGKELIENLKTAISSYKGLSPDTLDNQGRKIDGKWMSYREIMAGMEGNLAQGIKDYDKAVKACRQGAALPQLILDATLAYYTQFLTLLMPGKSAHIDVRDILAGYPLGGPDAFLPSLREHILKNLGLQNDTGDLVKFLRDPIQNGASFMQQAFANPALKISTDHIKEHGLLGGPNSVFRKAGIKW